MRVPDETQGLEFPLSSSEMIDQLLVRYPPRCLRRGEPVEDHVRYAAVVEFVHGLAQWRNEELEAYSSEDHP